jgi:hypothetical protein
MHNREPWRLANVRAPTAPHIAIAFLKYDVAPWIALIGLPPLHKSQPLKPRYTHYLQEFFFALAYFFWQYVLTPKFKIYFSRRYASGKACYLFELTAQLPIVTFVV